MPHEGAATLERVCHEEVAARSSSFSFHAALLAKGAQRLLLTRPAYQ
jgi:hypothetical protein